MTYSLIATITLQLRTTIDAESEVQARKDALNECRIHGSVINLECEVEPLVQPVTSKTRSNGSAVSEETAA